MDMQSYLLLNDNVTKAVVGDTLYHLAEKDSKEAILIDIDLNALHGLLEYQKGQWKGERQWIPREQLTNQEPAQPPTPIEAAPETPAEAPPESAPETEQPVVEPAPEPAPAEQPATEPAPA